MRSLGVAIITGQKQLGEFWGPVEAGDGAVARPALIGELATDAEMFSGVRCRQTRVTHVVSEDVDILRYCTFHNTRRSVEEMDEVRGRYNLQNSPAINAQHSEL